MVAATLTIHLKGDQAAFYRVYQKGDVHQIALVPLNKGDSGVRSMTGDRQVQNRATSQAATCAHCGVLPKPSTAACHASVTARPRTKAGCRRRFRTVS